MLGVLILGNFIPLLRSRLKLYVASFLHLLSRVHPGVLAYCRSAVLQRPTKGQLKTVTKIAPSSKTDFIASLFHLLYYLLPLRCLHSSEPVIPFLTGKDNQLL